MTCSLTPFITAPFTKTAHVTPSHGMTKIAENALLMKRVIPHLTAQLLEVRMALRLERTLQCRTMKAGRPLILLPVAMMEMA